MLGLNPSQGQLPLRTRKGASEPDGSPVGLNPSQGQLPLRTLVRRTRD